MINKAKLKKIFTKLFVLFPGMPKEGYKDLFCLKSKKTSYNLTPEERNVMFFKTGAKINYVAVIVWSIIGLIMTVSGREGGGFWIFLGILIMVLVATLFILSNIKQERITKQEIENYIFTKKEQLKQEGMVACGVDVAEVSMAGEPLCISYYIFSNVPTPYQSRDGVSSNINVTCFYAGLSQLYVYSCKCSIINNEQISASQDFFYQDMVLLNISTDTAGKLLFEIKLNSGDTFRYNFPNDTQLTQQLNAIKNLVRDKRNNTR